MMSMSHAILQCASHMRYTAVQTAWLQAKFEEQLEALKESFSTKGDEVSRCSSEEQLAMRSTYQRRKLSS